MQNRDLKIIGDQLPTKSPLELHKNSYETQAHNSTISTKLQVKWRKQYTVMVPSSRFQSLPYLSNHFVEMLFNPL